MKQLTKVLLITVVLTVIALANSAAGAECYLVEIICTAEDMRLIRNEGIDTDRDSCTLLFCIDNIVSAKFGFPEHGWVTFINEDTGLTKYIVRESDILDIGPRYGTCKQWRDEQVAKHRRTQQQSTKTFREQQNYVDRQILGILKDELERLEHRIENNPPSVYLKNQRKKLKDKISRMEER